MTSSSETRPLGAAGAQEGLSWQTDSSKYNPQNPPAQSKSVARRRAHLRLVGSAPPPRPHRLEVRISATDGRAPYGRSRIFKLLDRDFERLIDHALWLESA
jgi:hypothetical protein